MSTDERVFELRTYKAAPGRLEALNDRFRDHTVSLFEKHGMEVIGFWEPLSDERSPDTLIYLLAFPSKAAAEESWRNFMADPEWVKVKVESQTDGVPLAASWESVYMTLTDYSPSPRGTTGRI